VQLTRRFLVVWGVLALVGAVGGWQVAAAIGENPPTVADTQTRTVRSTVVHRRTRFVTVRVRGRVIRRVDHVLVVQVPEVVFHTRTKPRRRIVVPAHVVRIREKHPSLPGPPVQAAVVGVAPPPVTVTVPVTVEVPGPTTTVTGPTTTVTLPQATTTETSVTTLTVSVPLTTTGGSP
jgi:hypothetical protein